MLFFSFFVFFFLSEGLFITEFQETRLIIEKQEFAHAHEILKEKMWPLESCENLFAPVSVNGETDRKEIRTQKQVHSCLNK